jgi:hypothetical protein
MKHASLGGAAKKSFDLYKITGFEVPDPSQHQTVILCII